MKKSLLIALALVAVLFLAGWTLQSKPSYEYKVVFAPVEKKINELAVQGWEVVTVDGYHNMIFKRAK